MLTFTLTARDGPARTGLLTTAHGTVETPAFMTVGTLGAAKGLTTEHLRAHGAQVLLMNAFHLAWRPGERLIAECGGLHKFCGWPHPVLTDSGGYQIFSLPGLRQVTEEGAAFASPVNGDLRLFTPEAVVEIQAALAPDIAMPLDQCPPHPCSADDLSSAVARTLRWGERSLRRFRELAPEGVSLFGIVQGGCDARERLRSLEGTCALGFAGFALGGYCVGESVEATADGVTFCGPKLPEDKPRYLMGMGTPADILHAVGCGLDMFDCTLPTRNGRNALAFTAQGPLRLRNARFTRDMRPLDETCGCYVCRTCSRAFLRHLFLAGHMNGAILTSLHNVAFYLDLVRQIREAVRAGGFLEFRRSFLSSYMADAWAAGTREVVGDS